MDFGLKEIFDFFPFAPVAELAQGFAFDLADTFTRYVELFSDFFERSRVAVVDAVTKS